MRLKVFCVVVSLFLALGAAAADAQNFAYVANQNSDSVSVINTASNTVVATVGVGSLPTGVAITPTQTPANKDACKNGGWRSLTRADGSAFKNQGDCIQYVNTGK